jgi:hypothetical protein
LKKMQTSGPRKALIIEAGRGLCTDIGPLKWILLFYTVLLILRIFIADDSL